MKTIAKLFVLTSLLLLIAASGRAQITASSSATATIVATIDLTLEVPLDFGNLAVTGTSGVVTLEASAASTRSQVGGVTFPVVTGLFTAAIFTVNGEPNSTYAITLPLPAFNLTITNTTGSGGETMTVNNFTSSPTPTGTLDATGAETLYVGADLLVGANQAPGVYVSPVPFDVTVNYN
jgi:hypothetical protein